VLTIAQDRVVEFIRTGRVGMSEAIVSSQSRTPSGAHYDFRTNRFTHQPVLSKEGELDHGYAKLGLLLVEVSEQELWREAVSNRSKHIFPP